MTYQEFQQGILNAIKNAGNSVGVRFYNDKEKGKYTAICSDGVRFTGNSTSFKVTVRWASHQAQFELVA